jgi:hypothetical protein
MVAFRNTESVCQLKAGGNSGVSEYGAGILAGPEYSEYAWNIRTCDKLVIFDVWLT